MSGERDEGGLTSLGSSLAWQADAGEVGDRARSTGRALFRDRRDASRDASRDGFRDGFRDGARGREPGLRGLPGSAAERQGLLAAVEAAAKAGDGVVARQVGRDSCRWQARSLQFCTLAILSAQSWRVGGGAAAAGKSRVVQAFFDRPCNLALEAAGRSVPWPWPCLRRRPLCSSSRSLLAPCAPTVPETPMPVTRIVTARATVARCGAAALRRRRTRPRVC
jgi:hypothetical protein